MRARTVRSFSGGLLVATAALAAGVLPAFAQAGEPPSIMLTFDGSGSMWGNIDGARAQKFVLARDALGKALQSLPATARVGLISTGQRRRGDCQDVAALVELSPLEHERLMAPLDKLNPRGKGPIVLAMREAAKALGGARNASIIVLHDDLDNCQQDACAAAEEIHAANAAIRIHTVSIGLAAEDAARMACVAKTTGGKRFEAKDAGQVAMMIAEAVRLASLDGGGRAPAAAAGKTAPAAGTAEPAAPGRSAKAAANASPAPSAPLVGPPGLRLSASLGPKSEPLTSPVAWRVFRDGDAAGAQPLFEATSPQASFDTAPGSYLVEAKVGLVTAQHKFDVVKERPTRANVVLNAGAAWLLARTHKGGALLKHATFTVSEVPGGDVRSKIPGKLLWMSGDVEPLVHLPAATYRIGVRYGLVGQERIVVIEPGMAGELDVVLNAGHLQLKAVDREGGSALDDVVFVIDEDDPDAPQGRREVARSAAPTPDFVLQAGTYYLTARRGVSVVHERIALGAGDDVVRAIPLGLSRVTLAMRLDGAVTPDKEQLTFHVLRTDGESREVGRYVGASQRLDLPAGRYRIEARAGTGNVRGARDLEVAAGRGVQVSFELQAARLTLKAGGGLNDSNVVWEVRDSGGHSVLRAMGSETRTILTPGKYTVRAEAGGQRFDRTVELKAGERRTVVAE